MGTDFDRSLWKLAVTPSIGPELKPGAVIFRNITWDGSFVMCKAIKLSGGSPLSTSSFGLWHLFPRPCWGAVSSTCWPFSSPRMDSYYYRLLRGQISIALDAKKTMFPNQEPAALHCRFHTITCHARRCSQCVRPPSPPHSKVFRAMARLIINKISSRLNFRALVSEL